MVARSIHGGPGEAPFSSLAIAFRVRGAPVQPWLQPMPAGPRRAR